jgi:hypothetical protein
VPLSVTFGPVYHEKFASTDVTRFQKYFFALLGRFRFIHMYRPIMTEALRFGANSVAQIGVGGAGGDRAHGLQMSNNLLQGQLSFVR